MKFLQSGVALCALPACLPNQIGELLRISCLSFYFIYLLLLLLLFLFLSFFFWIGPGRSPRLLAARAGVAARAGEGPREAQTFFFSSSLG